MNNLVYLLAPIGCAVLVAVCMAMMARGMRRNNEGHGDAADNEEVAVLRAEVGELRSERAAHAPADG